jgi:phage tail-like protein
MTSGTETGRWTFTNAWPSKWSASDLDVGSDDVMSEEVTLQIEHIQRDK